MMQRVEVQAPWWDINLEDILLFCRAPGFRIGLGNVQPVHDISGPTTHSRMW